MKLCREKLLRKRPRGKIGQRALRPLESLGIARDREKRIDRGLIRGAVAVVYLLLPIESGRFLRILLSSASVGIERTVVQLFPEEEEVRDVLLLLGPQRCSNGGFVFLRAPALGHKPPAVR